MSNTKIFVMAAALISPVMIAALILAHDLSGSMAVQLLLNALRQAG
jgi:hypothetical protein